jgi:DNA-binding transcriptional regulator YiaG
MHKLTLLLYSGIMVKRRKTMRAQHSASASHPVPLAAALRSKLGIPRKVFSRLTGFSERVIANWESGKPMSEPSLRRMREIERLRDRLAEVVNADAIPSWLDTPNSAFDGLKPLEVIERGEIDRLWKMIFYLESGVAS